MKIRETNMSERETDITQEGQTPRDGELLLVGIGPKVIKGEPSPSVDIGDRSGLSRQEISDRKRAAKREKRAERRLGRSDNSEGSDHLPEAYYRSFRNKLYR